MTRPPARPTLKLPAKPAPEGDSEARTASRKPVRSGFKAPKPSVSQRAKRHETIAQRSAAKENAEENRQTRPARATTPKQFANADDRPRSEFRKSMESAEPNKEVATQPAATPILPRRNASARDEMPKVKKDYPKRGIARSTGARAFPPARPTQDDAEGHSAPAAQAPRHTADGETAPRTRATEHPVKRFAEAERTEPRAKPPTDRPGAERRPLKEPPRLAKRVSELFGCSRREADEWIENGWVRVDGVVVTTLGARAHPKASIEIKNEAKSHRTESITIILNKPVGMPAGPEEGQQKFALQLLQPENRWSEDQASLSFKATHLRSLALAGRLDPESSGLLVFTQEGSVARRVVGDDARLEKEYLVCVEGELSAANLKKLNFGLSLDDIKLKRAEVSWQHENHLRFVLHESKPQQIQRMCELVGLRVLSIKRLRIGSIPLGKLPEGQWRYLREGERF